MLENLETDRGRLGDDPEMVKYACRLSLIGCKHLLKDGAGDMRSIDVLVERSGGITCLCLFSKD